MQSALTYRTNRDLFSNHYLSDHLRQTEPWRDVDREEVREAYDEIRDLWTDKQDRVADYNEAQLERNFIRPVFDILGIPFEIEETVMRTARRPDYGFFPSTEAADAAFDRADFYEEAIAVADAKYWGRELDTRGEKKRDYENPSYQIHDYLMETPPQWGVLTNGKQWRLYYGPTSHRLDSYYEIDLPELIQFVEGDGGIEDFKDFYLFFRQQAFLPDRSGDCFLDDVYDESGKFAEAIGEDLQNNIYEAIRVLAEGFLDTNDDLDEDDLPLIHDSSLIYLYRLIFVLYAESEGRDLLPTNNDIYSGSYSLNELKETVADRRDETQQHYQTFQTHLWDRLEELFVLIDQGSQGEGIPKDQLYIPAYNGGLFRTSPDPDDSEEAQFLANHEADDAHLAEVIDLLTRRDADEGDGQVFVDYSSLDERHLGSIYEGLLEYKLDVADEPLTVDDGEYSPAGDGDEIEVKEGDVYLRTDAGERKATGSYYTPEYVVEYIVDETLGPLVDGIREDLVGTESYKQGGFAGEFADRVFDLKVLDPAMGSGHFLVNAVDYLAREIIDAQERQDQQAVKRGDEDAISDPRTEEGELRDINWARRKVAQRCIYGVDLNPLATELAKVSLWLRTLAAEQPLAFLDHHLKTGNSIVGSDIENVLSNGGDDHSGQTQLSDWMDQARQRAIEHVMERFTELLSIENETLADIKEMEEVYEEVRGDPLYQHLIAMANVHTAAEYGLDMPEDAEEKMAEALRDDSWKDVEDQDWFQNAQSMAEKESFFHWELEFPVAFYDDDGQRRLDSGFDAVVGNPPYVFITNIPEIDREYFSIAFDTWHRRYDLYGVFVEKGMDLTTPSGTFGYIIPHNLITNNSFEHLRRKVLDDSSDVQVIDFTQPIFSGVANEPMLLLLRMSRGTDETQLRSTLIAPDELDSVADTLVEYPASVVDGLPGRPFVVRSGSWITKMLEHPNTTSLDNYIDSVQGVITGDNDRFLSDEREDERYRQLIRGNDIGRYSCQWSGEYILYDPSLYDPSVGARPRDPKFWNADEKIMAQAIRNVHLPRRIVACVDTDQFVGLNSTINMMTKPETDVSLYYLKAIISSAMVNEYFRVCFVDNNIATQNFESIPIYKVDFNASQDQREEILDQIEQLYEKYLETGDTSDISEYCSNLDDEIHSTAYHDLLDFLSHQMVDLKAETREINLRLLDYISPYSEGQSLTDIGNYQPPEGIGESVIAATKDEYENLRVGGVSCERDGQETVIIYLRGRYKPENEEEYETDSWGYIKTELLPAMRITGLTERQAELVEAFVPIAVNKAGNFAGFREKATKTMSLVDRLEEIVLPDPEDVADGLSRYIDSKERAKDLELKIERTDQLVDELVYNLYGLTDEEINTIEETSD